MSRLIVHFRFWRLVWRDMRDRKAEAAARQTATTDRNAA